MAAVYEALRKALAKMGLSFNPGKTEVYSPNRDYATDPAFERLRLLRIDAKSGTSAGTPVYSGRRGIIVVGVPVGHEDFEKQETMATVEAATVAGRARGAGDRTRAVAWAEAAARWRTRGSSRPRAA